jgi:hypothetical protein
MVGDGREVPRAAVAELRLAVVAQVAVGPPSKSWPTACCPALERYTSEVVVAVEVDELDVAITIAVRQAGATPMTSGLTGCPERRESQSAGVKGLSVGAATGLR